MRWQVRICFRLRPDRTGSAAALPFVTASSNARRGLRWNSEGVALHILLVDDNPSCAGTVRLLLERQGAQVIDVACRSAEAVRLTAELHPDVVLIDLMLGDECGLDVANLLARDDSGDTPPMILISAHSLADVEELIATSPVAGFLPKQDLSVDAIRRVIGANSTAVRNR
jgi:CheY-like chemotaxis protein